MIKSNFGVENRSSDMEALASHAVNLHLRWSMIGAVSLALVLHASAARSQVVTKYSYDAGDDVIQVIDPRGLVTKYVFDGLGQQWQQVSPDTGATSFAHDSYGRLSSMTRADGGQITYGYDGINRRISETAGGQTHTFTYDACTNGVGRLCSASDATGKTTYTYSPEGWITGRGFAIAGTSYSLGYGYNSLGQVTTVVYPDGNQALYTYANGVVSAVQIKVGNAVSNAATGVTYRPNDAAMSQWTSGNGLVNTLSYDTDGRLTTISVPGVQSLSFSYDTANRVTGIANGMDGDMTQSFGYDAMSRLISVYAGADNEAFQYDANGNRIKEIVNGGSAVMTVQASNNWVLGRSGTWNTNWGFDAKGNLTTVNGTKTFVYSPFNRLQSAGSSTYYVNPEGQRLSKVVGGAASYFAPDSAGPLLAEYQPSAHWIDYIWLNGRLIARVNGGAQQFIVDDQLGRPEAITDTSKTVVWRARNFAFDRTVTVNNAVPLNLGFPGQYYDAESALWNNGYRDYSAGLGRYIESDPLGLAAGINTYAYAGGNPLGNVDPLGLAIGDAPPAPPGLNDGRGLWSEGTFKGGRTWLRDPDGTLWIMHKEDAGHWRHWDKVGRDGDDQGRWPPNTKKGWPGQKKLKSDQCESDPSGDAPPYDGSLFVVPDFFQLPVAPSLFPGSLLEPAFGAL